MTDDGYVYPITKRVLRHYCPFCSRGHQKLNAAARHIERCFKNPAARSCKTCALYEPGERADLIGNYPGCAEACGEGLSMRPMPTACPKWLPLRDEVA